MNFLSHYYFDRNVTNCYHILGTVLPDLLKNADKTIIIHPEKLHHHDQSVNDIIKGWNKHLEVDRYFHSSDFFMTHSHQLKKLLTPAITGSPAKPFFLGHIAIELLLDNLLITTGKIKVDSFYILISSCHHEVIHEFLTFSGIKDTTIFLKFLDDFIRHHYLDTYTETQQVAYALKRICMRVWKDPFTPAHELAMSEVLITYRERILSDFMVIFNEIESKLNTT